MEGRTGGEGVGTGKPSKIFSRPCRPPSGCGRCQSVTTGSPLRRSGPGLGDAPGRWKSFRHLQAHAGVVPVTMKSGKQQRVVQFRFACDKSLRYVVDQVAFLSMLSSEWARAYYD